MISLNIVGTRYRSPIEQLTATDLASGSLIKLEPEPTNQYDKNAIKVIFNDRHIGYVSKNMTKKFHKEFENSKNFFYFIIELDRGFNVIETNVIPFTFEKECLAL